MATTTIEKHGIVGLPALGLSLMQDLEANGFITIYPQTGLSTTSTVATFEASNAVDPLGTDPLNLTAPGTQPWRIRIEATADFIKVNLGTVLQLDDGGFATVDGSDSNMYQAAVDANLDVSTLASSGTSTTSTTDVARHRQSTSGHLDGADTILGPDQALNEFPLISKEIFYPPSGTATFDPGAAPISYHLTISDHGIAFMSWTEGSDSIGSSFSWFVVQRPVDNVTGQVLVTGKCPVFALWSGGGGGSAIADSYVTTLSEGFNQSTVKQTINEQRGDIWRMTVREIDVNRPTPPTSATKHSEDSHSIINPSNQVAISENNQYIITFPSGLNTNRYVYKHELDLIAYTSSDVISQYSTVDLTVYGEATPRSYRAMNANGKYNTGMRVLFLT